MPTKTTISTAQPVQTTFLGNLGHAIGLFFSHEVAPFLIGLWHMIQMDVMKQLIPIAMAEADKLDQALLTGGYEGFLKAFNAMVPAVLQAAESAGLNASIHDVLTTVQGVLAQKVKAAG